MRNACLSRAPEFTEHGTLDGTIEVCIIKYDKRRIASELHAHFLQRPRCQLGQHLPNISRAGERDLLYGRICAQLSRGYTVLGGKYLYHLRGSPASRASLVSAAHV
jgi:hypothetical protein